MTTLIDGVRARAAASSHARYFYFYMALSCMAVAFLGFAPTYWLPLASRTFPSLPVIHFHGMLFFTWTLYFAFQTWLAASGQIARHRTVGMIGVSLATAMTIFGCLAAVSALKREILASELANDSERDAKGDIRIEGGGTGAVVRVDYGDDLRLPCGG
jgi:hypothetical protein